MFLTFGAVSITRQKKAAKFGFSTLNDYMRDKLPKEAEAFVQQLQVAPTKKRVKSQPIKR